MIDALLGDGRYRCVDTAGANSRRGGRSLAANANELVRNTLIEKNIFYGEEPAVGAKLLQVSVLMGGYLNTVRNNVFNANMASPWYRAVKVDTRGVSEPDAEWNSVLHNTVYRSESSSEFWVAEIGQDAANTTVKNNLYSIFPVPSTIAVVADSSTSSVVSNNVGNSTASLTFVDAANGDFSLLSTASVVDQGDASVDVFDDFVGVLRDLLPDCGAFED